MQATIEEKHLLQTKFKEKFAFLYDKHSFFYYVLVLILVGLSFFGYALITEKFTTPFSGDFAQQYYAFEYNFYDDWWTFFKTGHFPFYDSNTFLGADNVISNTYYGLFSPFTFPILFFPRSFVPQAMAFMTIAKLVTGALLFRIYLKYMGASETSARIFSIAYAFMGWTAYYLWFNNFTEVLAFFPLILFGIEKIIRQKQIWFCSLGFFLMGLGNYFFLLTFGIFGVVYATFRFFQTIKERGGWKNYKDHLLVIGLGILGFALGYLMCAVVMIPAVIGSFGISRTSTSSEYLGALKAAFAAKDYGKVSEIVFTWWHPWVVSGYKTPADFEFIAYYPLVSYFYPTLSCRYVNIIPCNMFENAGSSIFFFTPCIIMFGGCMYRSFRNVKISHFIAMGICVLCLFVPFFYFLSGAFTNNYGRWEIVVPALGLTYIALNFDHRNEIPKWTILASGLLALTAMILLYFKAEQLIGKFQKTASRSQAYLYSLTDDDQIAVVFYETILCGIETFVLAGFWKKKYLDTIVRLFIIGEAIVMGTVVANQHYLQSIDYDVNTGLEPLSHQVKLLDDLREEDPSFYRMYSSTADESHVNMPEAANYNGMTTFHTFYNNKIDDFLHMSNMLTFEESWSSHYLFKHQYLESFLGVKYYMTRDDDTTYYNELSEIEVSNLPSSYSTEGIVYSNGKVNYLANNVMASSERILFKENGGYLQNTNKLHLSSINFENLDNENIKVYGSKDPNNFKDEIEFYDDCYDLADYYYFRIVNDSSEIISASSIVVGFDHIYDPNVPLNFSLKTYDEENGFRIYKNNHHIDFGINYDTLYYKRQNPDRPVENQFYESYQSVSQYLRNEEVYLKGAILNDADVDEIKAQYPDAFNFVENAPDLEMETYVSELQGVYSPYRVVKDMSGNFKQVHDIYIDPTNPTKDLKPEFLTNTDSRKDKKTIPVDTYQMLYLPNDGQPTFPYGSKGTYFCIDYPVRGNAGDYGATVWLIDVDGNMITFDECRYTNSDVNYVGRGLYSTKPVSKIIICPMGEKAMIDDITIYYSPYDEVIEKLDKAADNGVIDLQRNVNDFKFRTNYDKEKFFVTQLAYTGGWKLKATLANGEVTYPKIYNAQGGFAGFVAPKGDVSYELTYLTPDFVKWGLVSVAAFIGLGAITATTILLQKKKEKRDESLSSN